MTSIHEKSYSLHSVEIAVQAAKKGVSADELFAELAGEGQPRLFSWAVGFGGLRFGTQGLGIRLQGLRSGVYMNPPKMQHHLEQCHFKGTV